MKSAVYRHPEIDAADWWRLSDMTDDEWLFLIGQIGWWSLAPLLLYEAHASDHVTIRGGLAGLCDYLDARFADHGGFPAVTDHALACLEKRRAAWVARVAGGGRHG